MKKLGVIKNLKDGAKSKAKNKVKRILKKIGRHALVVSFPWICVVILVLSIFDFAIEIFTSENNPRLIYDTFEIEDVAELIEIKEDGNGGYYLDFIDGIDDKLQGIINQYNKSGEYHNLPNDVEFLKNMIKAEVYTQFPDLGGIVPTTSEDGFQGAVQIRRVTPNKAPGEMKNTGKGETSNLEQGSVDEPINVEDRNDRNRLESWTNGQKLRVLPVDTPIYEDPFGVGFWQPMLEEGSLTKELKLQKGDIVTYKGDYEIHKNLLSKDQTIYVKIETEDGIEGYLKLSTVIAIDENETSDKSVTEEDVKLATASSRAEPAREDTRIIGNAGNTYKVAIAAGRNSETDTGIVSSDGTLVEEELTIQVAEKVEELLENYSNIEVVQTGSTEDNRDGVEPEDRAELTRNANPDLCIQIYFADGEEVGVETIFKEGDEHSQQLAEIISNNVSSYMGLSNLRICNRYRKM